MYFCNCQCFLSKMLLIDHIITMYIPSPLVLIIMIIFKMKLFAYSEHLIKQQADRLAEDGYRDAGYKYVSIDVSAIHLANTYIG